MDEREKTAVIVEYCIYKFGFDDNDNIGMNLRSHSVDFWGKKGMSF